MHPRHCEQWDEAGVRNRACCYRLAVARIVCSNSAEAICSTFCCLLGGEKTRPSSEFWSVWTLESQILVTLRRRLLGVGFRVIRADFITKS